MDQRQINPLCFWKLVSLFSHCVRISLFFMLLQLLQLDILALIKHWRPNACLLETYDHLWFICNMFCEAYVTYISVVHI